MATRVWVLFPFFVHQVSHPEGEADIITRGVSWKRDACAVRGAVSGPISLSHLSWIAFLSYELWSPPLTSFLFAFSSPSSRPRQPLKFFWGKRRPPTVVEASENIFLLTLHLIELVDTHSLHHCEASSRLILRLWRGSVLYVNFCAVHS